MVKGSINSSTNSRSRKRIKKYSPAHAYHNKIYNDGLKKNNFLARHPKHRWAYANQEKMGSSYVTSVSRPSVTTRGGRAIHFTPEQYEIQSFYVVEESFNLEIESQSFEEIINESEDGEILAIECITNSPVLTIEVVTYGLGNSPNIINNYSIIEMLRRGRGMTPAAIEILPNFRGKDPVGTPRRFYPFIARAKADILTDHLGDSREYYSFVYEPSIPFPYSAIIVNIKNTGTAGTKIADSINIHRRVYGRPPENAVLNATPFDSSILYEQPEEKEEEETPPFQESTTGVNPYLQNLPPPPANVNTTQTEDEFIESDDF